MSSSFQILRWIGSLKKFKNQQPLQYLLKQMRPIFLQCYDVKKCYGLQEVYLQI